jgi:hypothetical protein
LIQVGDHFEWTVQRGHRLWNVHLLNHVFPWQVFQLILYFYEYYASWRYFFLFVPLVLFFHWFFPRYIFLDILLEYVL